MKIWFGTHDDTEITDLPTDYLHWLRDKCNQQPVPSQYDGPVVAKAKRTRWQDFLSEVEDELSERGE